MNKIIAAVFICLWILLCLGLPVGMVWVVCHFVAKYW